MGVCECVCVCVCVCVFVCVCGTHRAVLYGVSGVRRRGSRLSLMNKPRCVFAPECSLPPDLPLPINTY